MTTGGMGTAEMATVAGLLARALRRSHDDAAVAAVRDEVVALCSKFTPYPDLAARRVGHDAD